MTHPSAPDAAHRDAVRRHLVERTSAKRTGSPEPGIFVRNYRHGNAQTPGWRLLRQRRIPGGARAGLVCLNQMTLQSIDQPAHQLRLDVYETVSPQAARDWMIDLLTGFDTLPADLHIGSAVGDADVTLPGDQARLFTRGNLVVSVVNAASHMPPVGEVAGKLDAFIVAEPVAEPAARPAPAAAAVAPAAKATAAPEVSPDTGPMVRWVSARGRLQQGTDGSVEVQDGPQEIVQHTLDGAGRNWLASTPGGGDDGSGGSDHASPPPAKRPARRGKR